MMKQSVLAMCLLFGLVATVSAAQVYKWVDKEGKVHFGDRPGDETSQQIEVKPPHADPETARRLQLREENLEDNRLNREEAQAAMEEEEKKQDKKSKNCEIASERLKKITESRRVFSQTEDGERHYLSDEERAAATKNAEDDVDKWCN